MFIFFAVAAGGVLLFPEHPILITINILILMVRQINL